MKFRGERGGGGDGVEAMGACVWERVDALILRDKQRLLMIDG